MTQLPSYQPAVPFVPGTFVFLESTLGRMVKHLLGGAFEGSTSSLVSQVLDQSKPSPEELIEIRRMLDQYEREEHADD